MEVLLQGDQQLRRVWVLSSMRLSGCYQQGVGSLLYEAAWLFPAGWVLSSMRLSGCSQQGVGSLLYEAVWLFPAGCGVLSSMRLSGCSQQGVGSLLYEACLAVPSRVWVLSSMRLLAVPKQGVGSLLYEAAWLFPAGIQCHLGGPDGSHAASPVCPDDITVSARCCSHDWRLETPLNISITDFLLAKLVVGKGTRTESEMVEVPMEEEEDVEPKDKRPVASTPVPGSPWCVVWTGDDRVFFFNPTIQLSVWDQPVDLKDRGEDLNRIIEDPPHKRKKDCLSTEDDSNSPSADDDDDDDDDDDEEHYSKTKRNKETAGGETFGTPPHRTVLPLELPFSTWEKELHKIVFDPRYLLLTSAEERKQVFDQFVKVRMKDEYREKKSQLLQAKDQYRKLLEESKITSRSTFKEFSDNYGRDLRFKQVLKKKDQEHFFNQFIIVLKKRDKENRMRLRKMR
ncbi:unnamed protein product [Coregonus sp. 'balchen']|nr:unnamed protein product [Coregonus sp. 'balchen']